VCSSDLAFDLRNGEILWETRLGTSVQGFPISFSVDGRQYIAVSTGLGGGSPRIVPSRLTPEIRYPASGNALHVFALPDGGKSAGSTTLSAAPATAPSPTAD